MSAQNARAYAFIRLNWGSASIAPLGRGRQGIGWEIVVLSGAKDLV